MITLTEVELAAELRFSSWRAFARARRAGCIPKPDLQLPDGPRWSRTTVQRWLTGKLDRDEADDESSQLIEALGRQEHGQDQAPGPAAPRGRQGR